MHRGVRLVESHGVFAGLSLFEFYRRLLAIIMCTYVVVRTAAVVSRIDAHTRSLDGGEAVVARYFWTLLLRTRFRRVRSELFQVTCLVAVLGVLIALHR